MAKKSGPKAFEDKRSLSRRYLFWLYKTTKDELDKVDRKFTQLDIDRAIQKMLVIKTGALKGALKDDVAPYLAEWKEYILQKEGEGIGLKFSSSGRLDPSLIGIGRSVPSGLDPKYLFLSLKLEAVTAITTKMFGANTLKEFRKLCEEAAMKMIMQDVSGRR